MSQTLYQTEQMYRHHARPIATIAKSPPPPPPPPPRLCLRTVRQKFSSNVAFLARTRPTFDTRVLTHAEHFKYVSIHPAGTITCHRSPRVCTMHTRTCRLVCNSCLLFMRFRRTMHVPDNVTYSNTVQLSCRLCGIDRRTTTWWHA